MIGVGNKNYCKGTYSKISFETFFDVIYSSISDPIIKLPNGLTCSQCILQVNLFRKLKAILSIGFIVKKIIVTNAINFSFLTLDF